MNAFDVAAVLIAVAATAGYLNRRLLRLPATSGTLIVALASSLIVIGVDAAVPNIGLARRVGAFLGEIDFNETLMHGMLSFLLFAGALHVDLTALLDNKWTIGVLATLGVLLSTAIIGLLTWWAFGAIGAAVPLQACLAFGALISPTDPIAVMGLLKELHAPQDLEAQIAGESLFNDGVGVVVFFAVLSLAEFSAVSAGPSQADVTRLATFFIREVAGGAVLGLSLGYMGYQALMSIDDHALEVLITLALATFLYSLSFWVHVSGPIAVVVAGVLIGNPGRRLAMSERTREHVDMFWSMIDEILNAILFLVLGLQVLRVSVDPTSLGAGLIAIPIVLFARLISVGLPIAVMGVRRRAVRRLVPVLTWAGLRGGISIAMVLSLPPFPARDLLFACTYCVVIFSVVAQGLTMRRVLIHYGIAKR